MKRIPPVLIAALGAGLIGTLVMIAGAFLFNGCYDEQLPMERCLRVIIDGWMGLIVVFVCAGIGGAMSAWFFGRKTEWRLVRIVSGGIGAILATCCGGVLAGMAFWIVDSPQFDSIFAFAVYGGIFSFVFAFTSWFGAISWIGGFILLDWIVRRRRLMDDPRTERAAS